MKTVRQQMTVPNNKNRSWRLLIPVCMLISLFGCAKESPQPGDIEPGPAAEAIEPAPVKQKPLHLSFIGDIMAHSINYDTKDYRTIWIEIAPILLNDDFTFGNMENVLDADKPKSSFPSFNVHPDYADTAILCGVDVFSLANNHTADQGADSMQKTLAVMDGFKEKWSPKRSIYYSGIFRKDEEYLEPVYWESKGIRIAFLSVTGFSNKSFGLNRMNLVPFKRSKKAADALLAKIREIKQKADLVILGIHVGVEYRDTPVEYKAAYFQQLAKAGVDILWGHHPHVLQPVEKLSENGSDKVIMYSAGNFVSGMGFYRSKTRIVGDAGCARAAIIQVEVEKDGENLHMNVTETPIVNYYDAENRSIIVKLETSLDRLP